MPTVSLALSGNALKVYWNGILESGDTVDGANWQTLNPPTWPYTTSRINPMKFFRARQP